MDRSRRVIAALHDWNARVLVIRRRDTGFYTQPDAMLEPEDDPLDMLRALLWRELGISLPHGAFGPCECPPTWHPSNPAALTPTVGFGARVILTDLTPAATIADAVWVDPRDPHVGPLCPLTEDTILPRVVDAMGG